MAKEWLAYVRSSINSYTLIHPNLPHSSNIPHIFLYKVPKSYSTTITRLKLGNAKIPKPYDENRNCKFPNVQL